MCVCIYDEWMDGYQTVRTAEVTAANRLSMVVCIPRLSGLGKQIFDTGNLDNYG